MSNGAASPVGNSILSSVQGIADMQNSDDRISLL